MPAIVAALLLAGCEPENFNFSQNVTFTAATGYDNLPSTKTMYSGEETTVGTKTYERIDWVPGDLIRVYSNVAKTPSNEKYADYKVTGVTASGRTSKASVTNVAEHGLIWGDGTNKFYAMYPSPSTEGVPSDTDFSISPDGLSATLTGSIPATQWVTMGPTTNPCDTVFQPDMRYAYMWAEFQSQRGQSVNLEFHPAVTALEFTVCNSQDETINIHSVGLSSGTSPLTGHMEVLMGLDNSGVPSISQNTLAWEHGVTDTITVKFAPAGYDVSIIPGESRTFTVLTVPHNITSLDVTIKGSRGGEEFSKKLALKNDSGYVTFLGSKKYHICIGAPAVAEEWTYVIDEIPDVIAYGHNPVTSGLSFTVNSYKYSNLQPTHVPVSWTASIISVENAVATDLSPQEWAGNGNSNGMSAQIVTASADESDHPADAGSAAAAKLASNPYRGSDSEPWDLSVHQFYGTEAQMTAVKAQETANCYVVSSPGVYKFPLVYGNAITNGMTFTTAYNPGGPEENRLTTFQNYNGDDISSPYILTDIGLAVSNMEAAVVWQDVPEEKIILRDNNYGVGGTSASNAYMWFKIDQNDIKQGNIVLALRNKTSKTIVWSWHIWITEKVDETDFVKSVESPGTNFLKMMKYNLGWTDASDATGYAYPTRIWTVKVIIDEKSDVTRTFVVKQIGDSKEVPANIGTNTFYQWGRKDPELPARNSLQNKQFYSNDGYNPDGGTNESGEYILTTEESAYVFSKAIQHPYIHYAANKNTVIWTKYMNPWDANKTNAEKDEYVDKTVYDPCPPGFTVPRRNAFVVFTRKDDGSWETTNTVAAPNGSYSNTNKGMNFYTKRNRTGERIFFPSTGARREKSNFQAIFDLGYYWTSTQISSGGKGRSLQFMRETNQVWATYDQWNSAGYAIRPCMDADLD